jgi:hypothetical protein
MRTALIECRNLTEQSTTVSFLNQALEYPALRAQVRDLIGARSWPQMILRIGYPAQAEAHTGRRPWRDGTGWVGLEP